MYKEPEFDLNIKLYNTKDIGRGEGISNKNKLVHLGDEKKEQLILQLHPQ
jgi:hypothetical protein